MEKPTNDIKQGYKTTEFWLTLAVNILAILVAVGVISSTDADTIGESLPQIISVVVTVLGAVYGNSVYTAKRTELKRGGDNGQ